jgi:hypothetical protein
VGPSARPVITRAASALAFAAVVIFPLQSSRTMDNPAAQAEDATVASDYQAAAPVREMAPDILSVDMALPEVFADTETSVSFVAPAGWVRGPASALNPVSDPPEPVLEIVRYQMRLSDPTLYAAPIPITSGLIADAGAVISVGLARVDSGLVGMDKKEKKLRGEETGATSGFVTLDDEAVYEGVHIFSRYFFSRPGDRVVVIRAATADSDWNVLEDKIMSMVNSLRADPLGANAPAAPAPPPPPPPAAEPAPDATAQIRQRILSRAASLLGLKYIWGGNSTTAGMDCSAYVSWTWGVSRYTTDSIWNVSFPITKGELRPGDAMNLTIGRDPKRTGHIRIFEAWANVEHTLVWVYEETPPRVVHRVIVYDDRYQPIRLAGLSSAGELRVIPGTPAPTPTPRPATTRRPVTATPRPTARPTVRPSGSITPRPSGSVSPRPSASVSPRPSATAATGTATEATPRPSPTATRATLVTPTPTPRP